MDVDDYDGYMPIHVSCSTSGMDTLAVWHEIGADF
jgi:hypothetical protein